MDRMDSCILTRARSSFSKERKEHSRGSVAPITYFGNDSERRFGRIALQGNPLFLSVGRTNKGEKTIFSVYPE